MKAFVYLRVSTSEQVTGDGFDRQLAAIQRYAGREGIIITQVFREDLTGKTDMENRESFMAMVIALESNGVKTVVIEKLDRLARDLMVQESIVADLKKRGFTILSTCEPDLCGDDPSRILMRRMIGAFADYERAMIVMRATSAKRRMRERGEWIGGQFKYGTNEGESAAIERMKALREAGESLGSIAHTLNAQGFKTRHGKQWHASTVRGILTRSAAS